jgi:hypothetical protein
VLNKDLNNGLIDEICKKAKKEKSNPIMQGHNFGKIPRKKVSSSSLGKLNTALEFHSKSKRRLII